MKPPKRIGYSELNEIFPAFGETDPLLSIALPARGRYGQVAYHELVILAAIASSRQPRQVFEFGRFDGLTTLCLAQAAREASVYSLDLPDEEAAAHALELPGDQIDYARNAPRIARERWRKAQCDGRITEVLMDSAKFKPGEYSEGALRNIVDFVFVDGNHSYEYVRRDTEASLEMLGAGGIIVWHDYFKRFFPGVTAYIAEFAATHEVLWIEEPESFLETSLCCYIT